MYLLKDYVLEKVEKFNDELELVKVALERINSYYNVDKFGIYTMTKSTAKANEWVIELVEEE